ncbi:hypothetical protein [Frankia gtarii]|uniref:hypothetical protein n=1 Tax=Frankia gtarii TaxID=2950102 RepID=UPI0021C0514B|nr:hypothetical protein [Frankia gtarii]
MTLTFPPPQLYIRLGAARQRVADAGTRWLEAADAYAASPDADTAPARYDAQAAADNTLAFAARDLVHAVNDMPPTHRPPGWDGWPDPATERRET